MLARGGRTTVVDSESKTVDKIDELRGNPGSFSQHTWILSPEPSSVENIEMSIE